MKTVEKRKKKQNSFTGSTDTSIYLNYGPLGSVELRDVLYLYFGLDCSNKKRVTFLIVIQLDRSCKCS